MTVDSDNLRYKYNIDYYSGAQVNLYIGHIWVDEVTSISYNVNQNRAPLYGYSDQLYRGLAHGQVLVRGQFSINFKEAGYLWLVLNEYQRVNNNQQTPLNPFNNIQGQPDSGSTNRMSIEQIINKEMSQFEINEALQQLVVARETNNPTNYDQLLRAKAQSNIRTEASLTGFSSDTRGGGDIGAAENTFEAFEDMVWGRSTDKIKDEEDHRRPDDNRLNPFDIYLTYGDFANDNSVNHTIRKITDVSIIGTSQQVVIDGQPIQEIYDFIARNVV